MVVIGGVAAKPAATRARTNKKAGAAKLEKQEGLPVPPLPIDRTWHDATVAEWTDIWESEMAPEFTESDFHGLLKLADLIDAFWSAETPTLKKDLLVEIRLQRQEFGLTPRARANLHWDIDRGQQAKDRIDKRVNKPAPQPATGDAQDPRAVLGKQNLQVLQGGAAASQ